MYDALTIAAIVDEYAADIVGGRIQQVLPIDSLTVALEIYAAHRRRWLVVSAHPEQNRILLTSRRMDGDPERVTPLLLLLRKYARGGRVVAVSQPRYERILKLSIAKSLDPSKPDEDDETDEQETLDLTYIDLHVELMGRRSNIILTNSDGRILDSIKRVSAEMSRVRPIRPGIAYTPPPPQEKADPRLVTPERLLASAHSSSETIARWLVSTFVAVSPPLAREIAFRADLGPKMSASSLDDSAARQITDAISSIFGPMESGRWEPVMYSHDDGHVDFSAIRLHSVEQDETVSVTTYPTISEAAAAAWEAGRSFAASSAGSQRHAARKERLLAEVEEARDRVRHRVASLQEQQQRATEVEIWRQMGEAIYAAFSEIAPGQAELRTEDGLVIALDPALSASQNAQEYFERYRKARSAEEHLPELVEAAEHQLAYLDQLHTLARIADTYDEIESIRLEWLAWVTATPGAPRPERPKGARPAASARRPRAWRTASGDTILVGRTGPQNETVTFDMAGPDDLWLHARNMPGAHVILRTQRAVSDALLETAASLAAWYSDGRNATAVPVDVTERRHVRKIKGAGPGMVTYRNERTLNVRPQPETDLGLTS